MVPRRAAVAALSVALLASSACSLLTETDDLSGAEPSAARRAEATAVANGTPAAGGGSESGTTSAPARAASDPVPGCAAFPEAYFCEDFDRADALARWRSQVDPGGQLALDMLSARSSPNALRVSMAEAGASSCNYAYAYRDVAAPATRARLEYDLMVLELPRNNALGGAIDMASLDGSGSCSYFFDLGEQESYVWVEDASGGPARSFTVPGFVRRKEWVHMALSVDATAAPVVLTFSLDGQRLLDRVAAPAACHGGQIQQVKLGIYCAGQLGTVDVRMDNLAVLP